MAETSTNGNWKAKMLIIGALLGAVVGAGTAFLMARAAEEHHSGPPQISTTDALRIGINAVGLIRGIVALGDS